MIYIKSVKRNTPQRVTLASDKSDHQLVLLTEDDIGALAEAFGYVYSPGEFKEPLEGSIETLAEALRDRTKIEDPGYFTAIESGLKPHVA